MRWDVLAVPALALLAVSCGSGHRSATNAVVTAGGRIGPLRMDRSTRADVIAFAGRPAAERRDRYDGFSRYRALGYGCSKSEADGAWPLGSKGPFCQTVFFVNERTGKLGDFYTTSVRYSEGHGVRIGMRTARAEQLLDRRVDSGCSDLIYLGRPHEDLTIEFSGGMQRKVRGSNALTIVGGHVDAFALHGPRSDLGVFDCM